MKCNDNEAIIFKAVEMELYANAEVGNILEKMRLALEMEHMTPLRLEMVNGRATARFRLAHPIYLKDDYTDEGDDSRIYHTLTQHLNNMGVGYDFESFCYQSFGENGELPPWQILSEEQAAWIVKLVNDFQMGRQETE